MFILLKNLNNLYFIIEENSEVQSKLSDLDIQNQDTKVVVENSEKVEEADSSDLKEDDNNASQ